MREEVLNSKPSVKSVDLPRVLGVWDVISIIVGGVIGSGIFIVPATVALNVGSPWLIIAVWLFGGLLCLFGALAFGELAAMYPQAGGMYIYLREAYGSLLSFLFGWTLFLVIDSGAIATLAVAFSSKYLPHFFPNLSMVTTKLIAVGLIIFLAMVNYLGVRWGALLQNFLTLIKFGAILAICAIVFSVAKGNLANWVEPSPTFSFDLIGNFGLALVATLWAYKGWESSTFSAGEVKNPQKNLPLGLLAGTLIVIAIYLLANLAYLYAFPSDQMAKSDRIAADVMNFAVGAWGASLISLIILFSITGAANQNLLCSPRVYFAMARDGLFFKQVAAVHPRFLTPHVSIIIMAIWSSILSLSGTFEQLFTYVVFGQWLFFGLTVAAVIVLRKKKPERPRPYKTWGYPLTPIFFILAALYISVNTLIKEFWNSFAGLAIISLGIPAYFFWHRRRQGYIKGKEDLFS
ncbi:MAG: amino acid permease [Candidatus Aminicenantes bacterium]|nr:amino acid permease [Candidatus Aminicenantes bacterium]